MILKTPSAPRTMPVVAVFLICAFPQSLICQPSANLPVPEYYGIYAASNGRLIKLDARDIRAEKTVSVRIGQRQGVSAILDGAQVASSQVAVVPAFSPDLKIIVYSESGALQSPLQMAKSLSIVPLVFVRNLSVDTGFPNNVKRRGLENGWEYGNAPELIGLATGDHPEELELLVKPMAGQKDMVIAGFSENLKPGIYRFNLEPPPDIPMPGGGGRYFTFAVEPIEAAESTKCVDASVTYAMMVSNVKYAPCSGPIASPEAGGTRRASPATLPGVGGSTDDDIRRGTQALARKNEDGVISAWNAALSKNVPVALNVCSTGGIRDCDQGVLSLSAAGIRFVGQRQEVFSAPPTEVTPVPTADHHHQGFASFGLTVGDKKYTFHFIPSDADCTVHVHVLCPSDGITEQRIVGDFVNQAIPRLSSVMPQKQ